jgi:uncharacterized protein with PIN domain
MNTKTAIFLLHGALNDFSQPANYGKPIKVNFKGRQSAKHLIESLHIPHTEVGAIRNDHQAVDLSYIVQDGDYLEFFPYPPGSRLSKDGIAFLLDNHLGKLATYLRILGFDAAYQNDLPDQTLAEIAAKSGKILLTRDRGLLMRKVVSEGYYVRSLDPKEQLLEILTRYQLFDDIRPFKRCLKCNSELEPVEKEAVIDRLEPLTRRYYHDFHVCPECGQLYWKGSHYEHMQEFINSITD